MGFANWMVVAPSLEQEFQLEYDAKAIIEDNKHKEIAELCARLHKQNWYQQQIIKQATGHIQELEAKMACVDHFEEAMKEYGKRPWWRRLWDINMAFLVDSLTKDRDA
tara:strand:- start:736 stop:1059 length:324 start_codon:yes stop_codon:yes gene_type:complete